MGLSYYQHGASGLGWPAGPLVEEPDRAALPGATAGLVGVGWPRAGQDSSEPHHGQLTQRIQQLATGRLHFVAAKTNTFKFGMKSLQSANQVSAMQVAAGFSG